MKISSKEVKAVTALPGPKRYSHFIKRVVNHEIIWGLYQNGWALAGVNKNNNTVFPVWPAEVYAEQCAEGHWEGYQPRAIELDVFLNEIIPDLTKKNVAVCVFYLPNDEGVIPTTDQLIEDIKMEMEWY